MWFEALPSLAIIFVSMSIPPVFIYTTNRLFLGNAYKRRLYTEEDAHLYVRDARISGVNNPYKQIGLESLKV